MWPGSTSTQAHRKDTQILAFIEDEEVIEKILRHSFDYAQDRLGLWEVKAPSETIYLDDSESQDLSTMLKTGFYPLIPFMLTQMTRWIPI